MERGLSAVTQQQRQNAMRVGNCRLWQHLRGLSENAKLFATFRVLDCADLKPEAAEAFGIAAMTTADLVRREDVDMLLN